MAKPGPVTGFGRCGRSLLNCWNVQPYLYAYLPTGHFTGIHDGSLRAMHWTIVAVGLVLAPANALVLVAGLK